MNGRVFGHAKQVKLETDHLVEQDISCPAGEVQRKFLRRKWNVWLVVQDFTTLEFRPFVS